MKVKWKITLTIVVAVFAVLISVSFLFYYSSEKGRPPETAARPAELPKARPPEPLGDVDRLLEEMELGTIAFNVPANINIDDSPQIQLILSLAETIEKLKQSISGEGEKVGATIRVSDRMEARLSGYMFQITAITPEIQAVSKRQQTEWKWEVQPKKEGRHKLHLTLAALLEVDEHSTPRVIRTFDKIIVVNVTMTKKIGLFIKNNWQWLWAAILVPVVGWLWKRRKKQLTNTSN